MPSTYTLNNGIELIGTGEQSGTWGDTTNTNLGLLDTALDGQVSITLASAGNSGSPNNLPISDGAASDGRNRMITFADGGDLGATAFVQLTPNDSEKIIYVRNDLSGSRSVIMFQGTYNASNDYEIPAGTTAIIYFDGAGSGAVAANVFNNAHFDALNVVGSVTVGGGVTVTGTVDAGTVEFDNLSGTGAVSVTNILDEDDMSSDSATALSTQQSIKAYVDAQVGTADELSEVLANGNTTGGNNILFGDNDKAIFGGATSELQIYSDGSNSRIQDTATGSLILAGTNFYVNNTGDSKSYLAGLDGGSTPYVRLYYDGATRLDTSASGIDVSGAVTADGLIVDGNIVLDGILQIKDSGGSARSVLDYSASDNVTIATGTSSGARSIYMITEGQNALRVHAGGDISFYENTGTTPKFFWDASAESLGIGTSSIGGSATTKLHLMSNTTSSPTVANDADELIIEGSGSSGVTFLSTTASNIRFGDAADSSVGQISYTHSDNALFFGTNNSEAMRIDSSGNVGIGTSSPNRNVEVSSIYGTTIRLASTRNTNSWTVGDVIGQIEMYSADGTAPTASVRASVAAVVEDVSGAITGLAFRTYNNTERMRIDSSGNVGIGTSSPSALTHLSKNQATAYNGSATDGQLGVGSTMFIQQTGGSNTAIAQLVFQPRSGFGYNRIVNSGGSAPYMALTTNNAERMRIDSSGNVGIGTSSPSGDLQVQASNPDVYITSADTGQSDLYFGGTTAPTKGRIQYSDNSDFMTLWTNSEERMRIDSSGNLLVGTTDSAPGAGDTNTGVSFRAGGDAFFSKASSYAARFNRNTNDGDVVTFAKNGTTVGTIGVAQSGDRTYFAGGSYGIASDTSEATIMPCGTTGTGNDGVVSLGKSDARFKDLYLSGKAQADTYQFAQNSTAAGASEAIYRPTTGQMAFKANSSEAMRIDSSGNVGIGTSSIDDVLHVLTTSFGGITLECTGATADPTFKLLGDSGNYWSLQQDASQGDSFQFRYNNSEVMRIDSSGNVGIGTGSPAAPLEVSTSSADYRIQLTHTGGQNLIKSVDGDQSTYRGLFYDSSAHYFKVSDSEAMRIDASGNLLVGKTALSGSTAGTEIFRAGLGRFVRSGGDVLNLNRLSSDGTIVDFQQDGSSVGKIGNSHSSNHIGIHSGSSGIGCYSSGIYATNGSGNGSDNSKDLGASSVRWDDVYATNGTIQTSDRNEKQDIEALSDAEQRVAVACKGLLRKFRWIDSVAEKGDDARIHFGIIAQDLQDAFTAEGLDAGRYAMFISSTWWETQTDVEAVEAKEAYTRTDTYETLEEAPEGATERTRLGVRYPELLAFIIAAI